MNKKTNKIFKNIEQYLISFMRKINYHHWLSIVWVMLGVEFFIFQILNSEEHISIGEIGAYLSGIFAPVAWYWFYLSFKLQTSALEQQTRASNDQFKLSEINTKRADDQFKLSEINSRIANKQFEIYLEDREKRKPLFILGEFDEVIFLHSPERGETPLYFQCRFSMTNIGAESPIKMIEVVHPFKGKLIEPSLSSKYWMMASKFDNETIEVLSNLPIEDANRLATGEFDNSLYEVTSPDFLYSPEIRLARKMCQEYLLQCKFIIYYASESGSGSDEYEFILPSDNFILAKVYRQRVSLVWES